jgi:predicted transcriptional regulator
LRALDSNEILFELSNKARYGILECLYEDCLKHSELEEGLNIPGSEVSRHVKRLLKKGLIQKTDDGRYQITSIGLIAYNLMNILEISLNFQEFFNSHDISHIPSDYLLQLYKLKYAQVKTETLKNIEIWSNIIKNAKKYVFAIADQYQDSILPMLERKGHDQSIEIRAIIGKESLIPFSKAENLFENPNMFYDKIDVFKNIRVLDELNLSIVVSDRGSILFLKGENGEIDYSNCIFGENREFNNWSKDLFTHFWRHGIGLGVAFKKLEAENSKKRN